MYFARLKAGVERWNAWRKTTSERDIDLSGVSLQHADLSGVHLGGVNLRNAKLKGAQLNSAILEHADLVYADLRGAYLKHANLSNAHLDQAHLNEANLNEATLSGAQLNNADLSAASLIDAKMSSANLTGANLNGANLNGVNLHQANLNNAILTDAILFGADLIMATLNGTNLVGARLNDAKLSNAKLRGAKLTNANLSGTDLLGADLNRAELKGAFLISSNLTAADLTAADLRSANLQFARLRNAVLAEADLTGANLWETQRAGWIIKGVICEHAYWESSNKEPVKYHSGEFEKLHSEQTRVELFYPGDISAFEILSLPALIQHLADKHEGCTILLRSIEQTGGGAKITIGLGDASREVKERVEADAVKVVQAQLTLRDDEVRRLQIEKQYLENYMPRLVKEILTSAVPQVVFNAPVHTASLPSGNASIELHQTFNDNTELLHLIDKLITRNTELTPSQSAEVEAAKAELQKPTPDKPALKRSLEFLKDLATEAIKKGAGKLGERAASTDWPALHHQITQFLHHLS